MSEILHPKALRDNSGTVRSYRSEIIEIDFGSGGKAPTIKLKDGHAGQGVCLGCFDTPCMKKAKSEDRLPAAFESFPGDPSIEVCPTRALSWNEATRKIQIASNCIGCGLCVVRCPYGAMYLDEKSAAVLSDDISDLTAKKNVSATRVHPTPKRIGRLGKSTAHPLRRTEASVQALVDTQAMLFVRNILHELGVQCRVRRKGDNNLRIDAVVSFDDGKVGIAEVELSVAVLESPRAILEDIAVLHGRYAMPVANIVPISIVLSLPNARSEYYKVIFDIHRVLDLQCHTLTVGALLVLLWNFGHLVGLPDNLFITEENGADLLASVAKTLGKAAFPIDGEPYPGALRTAK